MARKHCYPDPTNEVAVSIKTHPYAVSEHVQGLRSAVDTFVAQELAVYGLEKAGSRNPSVPNLRTCVSHITCPTRLKPSISVAREVWVMMEHAGDSM